MNLEKIEIKNYKSYKGVHIIGPFDRFTSVIGPNGSGKSNILDAIIFAFNVPLESMRAKNQADVITHGESDCYVRIWIKSQIFERKLRRKDEGCVNGYMHNEKKVGQRDYNELLEKIGIFGKIRNFVICQGDIINSDVNLLDMIESVCGNTKLVEEYRDIEGHVKSKSKELCVLYNRRKELLRCVEEANESKTKEANFERLIKEKEDVERKIKWLEINKRKKKVEELCTELNEKKECEIIKNWAEEQIKLEKLRKTAAEKQREYFEKENEIFYKEKMNEKDKLLVREKVEETESMKNEYAAFKEKLRRKIEYIDNMKEKKCNERCASVFKEMREYLEKLDNDIQSIANDVEEKEYELLDSDEERQLNEAILNNFEKLKKRNETTQRIKTIVKKKKKLEEWIEDNKIKKAEKEKKKNALEKERMGLKTRLGSSESMYDRVVEDEKRKEEDLAGIMKEILLRRARKNEVRKTSVLNNAISNLKNLYGGVHGKVLDIVRPIQKRYETSVGVLLGAQGYAVVVENERVALDCIKYMKEHKAGKLTFLPVSRIKGRGTSGRMIQEENGLWEAVKCVDFDEKYTGIVEYILSGSLIVEDGTKAKDILYRRGHKGNACALDGTLYTPDGLISGGKEVHNKFEENVFEELMEKRREILEQLRILRERKETFGEVGNVKKRISELEKMIAGLEEEEPIYDIEEQAVRYENEMVEEEKKLRELEADLGDYETLKKRIDDRSKERERALILPLLVKIGLSSLSDYKLIREEIGEMKRISARLSIIEENMENAANITVHGFNTTEKSSSCEENREMQEFKRIAEDLEEIKRLLKEKNEELRIKNEKKQNVEMIIVSKELQKARIEEEIKELMNEDDATPVEDNASLAELKQKLDDLVKEIQLNIPSGISNNSFAFQFEKVDAEYRSLKDLVTDMKNTFYKIKSDRIEIFRRCFTVVADSLTVIYRELSSKHGIEGKAYVVYEGDPFVNNLKYYVMPPGGKFTEFSNLSGGEKSMALLAFLFSLNKYRQAPFYIFDEVDSALDRSNVEKLTNYFLQSSEQLIVITLKHKVFQHSDSLFGIYKCPNTKVSKIISCKLED